MWPPSALLLVLVVILFLQTWRASIILIVAIPVSLVGTFAVLAGLGFSLNSLSLFGLVLPSHVVDDAIVVVENVERNLRLGLSPPRGAQDDGRGWWCTYCNRIDALRRLHSSAFIPGGGVLSAVRRDDRGLHADLLLRFIDAQSGVLWRAAAAARNAPCLSSATSSGAAGLGFFRL